MRFKTKPGDSSKRMAVPEGTLTASDVPFAFPAHVEYRTAAVVSGQPERTSMAQREMARRRRNAVGRCMGNNAASKKNACPSR